MDSPYETHRPSSHVTGRSDGSEAARSWISPRSRLLPIPGSPVRNRIPPAPARTASNASRATASSRSRPTSRAWTPSRPRTRVPASRAERATAAWTGADLPFSSSTCGSSHSNRASTSLRVAPPTRTVPGSAAVCRRAAMFTASPVAPYSTRFPAPTAPTTTGPVATPTRTASGSTAQPRATSAPYSATSSAMARPARMARSGSSSCAAGAPNSASTPSPARSFTVPPKASTRRIIRATASPTISRTSSGSSCSARGVDPTRSANSAVTVRRSSSMGRSGCRSPGALPLTTGLCHFVPESPGRAVRLRELGDAGVGVGVVAVAVRGGAVRREPGDPRPREHPRELGVPGSGPVHRRAVHVRTDVVAVAVVHERGGDLGPGDPGVRQRPPVEVHLGGLHVLERGHLPHRASEPAGDVLLELDGVEADAARHVHPRALPVVGGHDEGPFAGQERRLQQAAEPPQLCVHRGQGHPLLVGDHVVHVPGVVGRLVIDVQEAGRVPSSDRLVHQGLDGDLALVLDDRRGAADHLGALVDRRTLLLAEELDQLLRQEVALGEGEIGRAHV